MPYAIRRIADRDDAPKWRRGAWYASQPGSAKSYTQSLRNAALFPTREDAEASGLCGNETIEPVDYP